MTPPPWPKSFDHYSHAHTLIFHFPTFILSLAHKLSNFSLHHLHSSSSSSSFLHHHHNQTFSLSPSKTTSFCLWRQDLCTTSLIFKRTQELSHSLYKAAIFIILGSRHLLLVSPSRTRHFQA